VIYGTLLILILRFRPQGIVPERHNVKEKSLKAKHAAALGFIDGRQGSGMIMLAGKHLRKDFGGIRAVDDVSIDLRAGHVTGLIGPNGAGKTTAFNLLTGFILPTDGEIYLGGHPITGLKPHAIVRAGTARSFQDLRLFSKMTVLENVLVALPRQSGDNLWHVFFSPRRVAREERENVGKALGILQFVGLAQRKLDRAEDLSFAESKLLVIARVLATEADVLLLDEPLSGLDPPTLAAILPTMRRLAEMGKAVCIVEHNLDVIRSVCDSAYYLDEGRIMAVGAPAELMADANLQERYFQ
jgi:branched-chain amino acid transport system permease protein